MSFFAYVFLVFAICASLLYVTLKASVFFLRFIKRTIRSLLNPEIQNATQAMPAIHAIELPVQAPVIDASLAKPTARQEPTLEVAQPAHSAVIETNSDLSDEDKWSQYDSPAYLRKGVAVFC